MTTYRRTDYEEEAANAAGRAAKAEEHERPLHPVPKTSLALWADMLAFAASKVGGEPDGPDVPGELTGDWTVKRGVTCVVCPACAFEFAAEHVDEPSGVYSCPNCGDLPGEQNTLARDLAIVLNRHGLS